MYVCVCVGGAPEGEEKVVQGLQDAPDPDMDPWRSSGFKTDQTKPGFLVSNWGLEVPPLGL